jgi:AraC family transcriptional regulator of adaptative response / DNA-3-methyladenine glycosylase II
MVLSSEACWRAVEARDARFAGRFVLGVVTTGIYCRPGCPARLPARRNVRFFAHPAAAEGAGFRACLRCRPDRAPSATATNGTSATVARALRLIGEGALDGVTLDQFASRLGVTDRWLRELFEQQLGASPSAVARTRRVHFARHLLEQTALPLPDVAAASGFASARRLHAAVRASFRCAPSALRARGARSNGASGDHGNGSSPAPSLDDAIELSLPARPPFDAAALLEFFGRRAVPGVEHASAHAYARSVRAGAARGTIELRPEPGQPRVRLIVRGVGAEALLGLASRAARLFDLDADVVGIAAHLRRDPALAHLPHTGVRLPGVWDPFEAGVRAMIGQQISVAAARTLLGRLVRACGEPLEVPIDGITHLFPDAAAVAAADLGGVGLPRARAASLRRFAEAVASGELNWNAITDLDGAVAALTRLPGIGPWTAHYVAMRGLGEPDAFPAGDLGVRQALARGGPLPSEKETHARAERWRPWRAYAALALWQHPAPPVNHRDAARGVASQSGRSQSRRKS